MGFTSRWSGNRPGMFSTLGRIVSLGRASDHDTVNLCTMRSGCRSYPRPGKLQVESNQLLKEMLILVRPSHRHIGR